MFVLGNLLLVLWIGLSCNNVVETATPEIPDETGNRGPTPLPDLVDCSNNILDVVFVLDSSGSVGEANFTVMKGFVKTIVGNLKISADKTRVGLITFSQYPSLRIKLDQYTDEASLFHAIDNVPYTTGTTETQTAIDLLRQEGFKGGRGNAPQVGIVITDGKSFHTNQTADAAAAARAEGITMFAIGIGVEVNVNELNSIASDPDAEHVFTVDTFKNLITIVEQLTNGTCAATPATPRITPPTVSPTPITKVNESQGNCNRSLADIMFVLDSSGSLGIQNFDKVIQFVINIVNYLDIGANYTRVGVITYNNYPIRRIPMNQFTNKLLLVNEINKIPYLPGNTATDLALDMLRLEGFEGDRPDAPNIAIVVTDGLSTNPGFTNLAAEKLKNSMTNIFAIGIGAEIHTEELNTIASRPDYVYFVANFSNLNEIESKLAHTTCEVQVIPTTTPIPTTTTTTQTTTTTPFLTPSTPSTTTTLSTTPTTTTTTTTTPPTTPKPCVARVADVMFVLDTSGSIGVENFEKFKEFIKTTTSVFDIASEYTRIGVITFSTHAQVNFALNTYNTSQEVLDAIDQLPYSHGGTNTGEALELLRTTGFLYGRPSAPNIAIVVTDGLSKDSDATKVQASLAKQANITIIAIGVGNETDYTELTNMATFDVKTNSNLVYQVGDFTALKTLNNTVAKFACDHILPPASPPTTTATTTPLPGCHDLLPNCDEYGQDICYDYQPWARKNCERRCGFCIVSTPEPVCLNALDNCADYGQYVCTSVEFTAWTKKNCAKYCGFCGNETVALAAITTPQTTPQPTSEPACGNVLSNCAEYGGKSMCTDPAYIGWAKNNCKLYCGFCVNVTPVKGITLTNNVKCPDWMLPTVCTMGPSDGSCCPVPQCPDGFSLTAKLTSEFNLN